MSSGRIAIGLALTIAAAGCDTNSSAPAAAAQQAPAQPAAAPAPEAPPAAPVPEGTAASQTSANPWANRAPDITDADIPPLPTAPFPLARPPEVVRAVYTFAAKHPEVLSHVPCFCGCESRGHKHNDDCFVTERDPKGRPTKWEPHGLG